MPSAAVVGAPKLLFAVPPLTLFSEATLKAPLEIAVLPLYVFAPDRVAVPVPNFVKMMFPAASGAPLTTPAKEVELLSPKVKLPDVPPFLPILSAAPEFVPAKDATVSVPPVRSIVPLSVADAESLIALVKLRTDV